MMGVTGKPVGFNDMILPMESHGVKVISMGFFVPEETPVIWRGPMLHKAIEFLGDVYWGDLDFPVRPAAGDRRRVDQPRLVPARRVDARRHHAAGGGAQGRGAGGQDGGANQSAWPIGVVENMSWFVCPHCGEPTPIFGQGGGNEAAETLGVPLFAQVPLEPALRGRRRRRSDRRDRPGLTRGRGPRRAARELAHTTRSKVGKPLPLMARPGDPVTAGDHHGHAH